MQAAGHLSVQACQCCDPRIRVSEAQRHLQQVAHGGHAGGVAAYGTVHVTPCQTLRIQSRHEGTLRKQQQRVTLLIMPQRSGPRGEALKCRKWPRHDARAKFLKHNACK